jgi:hypothetical protein
MAPRQHRWNPFLETVSLALLDSHDVAQSRTAVRPVDASGGLSCARLHKGRIGERDTGTAVATRWAVLAVVWLNHLH